MMKLNLKSILFKIVLMITLASLMQGFILVFMSYSLTQKALYNQINDSGLKYIQSNSQLIGEWLDSKINEISIYSDCHDVRTMDWNITEPYLQNEISTKLNIYDHLFVADTEGNYNTTLKRNAGSIADRPYFSEVMKGHTVVSKPVISKTTGNQISVIAVPIKNSKGEVVGLMGGALNLVKLYKFIETSNLPHQHSYSFIIDKNGMIITHPDTNYIMKQNISVPSDLIGNELVKASKKILSNANGYAEYTNNDTTGLSYFSVIPNTDNWRIIIKVPDEYIQAPLNQANIDLAITGVVGFIVAVFLAVYVSKTISRPIIKLRDVFTRASNGDLSARADAASEDEIGQAAKSFNIMMQTISNLTFYDHLTMLPNKLQFMDRLQHEIADCRRDNERLSVIVFDLDKFENINNVLGPSGGDKLLMQLANRIDECLDENEIACRLGEDRFAILLPNNPQATYVVRACSKLLDMTKHPWSIDGHIFHITASIGAAFYPNDGEEAEELLKNAMTAMLRAKKLSRGSYQLYDSNASSRLLDIIELDNNLHYALENNELLLHYQPQVDIASGRIVGAEALIRWKHPKLGMISPAKFIPLAEENGLIVPIGDWVLKTACAQNKLWMDMGYAPIYISVNISALQISETSFIEKISQVLLETQMDPKYLELEITESIAMEDTETRIEILKTLREMGIRLAIDDFGTGYSSLNYLSKFHITTLKIDQSFIRELTTSEKGEAIASSILAIGQNLNLIVTAEGVETEEQLNFLKGKKCDIMQGYLFSKPLPSDQFEELIKKEGLAP